MRVTTGATGPVDTCECEVATPFGILERQQSREIVFFRVARLGIEAW